MQNFINKFFSDYEVVSEPVIEDLFGRDDVVSFMSKYSGASFNKGIYRLHSVGQVNLWTEVVNSVFPQYKNKIKCFGFDWLGRQFAIGKDNENQILMFDADTGEVLDIPVPFSDFHNIELVDYGNDALAENAFVEWVENQHSPLGHSECVTYVTPLYLGGKDELSNRERSDMGVHWELSAQLLDQIKPLKEGQRIDSIRAVGSYGV